MDDKYNYCDNAPAGFGFCFQTECASAEICLRALAARDLNRNSQFLNVANPKVVNLKGEQTCPLFLKAERVRLAYGFEKLMAKVPSGKVRHVRAAICSMVCRRDYYYLRSGEKPMRPEMQNAVIKIFKRYGLTDPIEFDRYAWEYVWS